MPMDNPMVVVAVVMVVVGCIPMVAERYVPMWVRGALYTTALVGVCIMVVDFVVHMERYFTTW